jgi:replicative superfamily II helicase
LLIRVPPGSGKTSILQLVAYVNTRKKGIFKKAYYINLMRIGEQTFDEFFEMAFGLDLTIWGIVKSCMSGSVKHLRISMG